MLLFIPFPLGDCLQNSSCACWQLSVLQVNYSLEEEKGTFASQASLFFMTVVHIKTQILRKFEQSYPLDPHPTNRARLLLEYTLICGFPLNSVQLALNHEFRGKASWCISARGA